jgi:capsular exopolysaccharide synthesis family protein
MKKPQVFPKNDDLTLKGLSLTMRRRRSIVLATTGCCLLLAASYCLVATRRYQATSVIDVQQQSVDMVGLGNAMNPGQNQAGADPLEVSMTMETQANILQSDTLALRVIEKLNLENTEDFKPVWNPISWGMDLLSPGGPSDKPNASLEDAPGRRTAVLKKFAKRLKVKQITGTRLIEISFLNRDPKTAAAVVNQLATALVDYSFQIRNNATNQVSGWLEGQLHDIKSDAEARQAKVAQLQRVAGFYSLGNDDAGGQERGYSSTLDRLQQANGQLSTATSNRIIKGGVYQMVQSGDPELISGLAGASLAGASPAVNNAFTLLQNLRQQQAALQTVMASDDSRYGTANPKLADEQASLGALNDAIKQEVKRIGERAANDYRAAQLEEAEMRRVYDQQRVAADKLNDKEVEYTIAHQEATNSLQLYQTLLQRLQTAGVLEGLHSTDITIVDPGRVPAKPARPNVPLYLAISAVAGLLLGCCGALFIDLMDDTVQSIASVEGEMQLPLIAVLPRLDRGESAYLPLDLNRRLNQPDGASMGALTDETGRTTAFGEALRAMRTALLMPRNGVPPKVILVTSAVPEEGKSTISANLATLLAQMDKRVLLVECDMRRPSFNGNPGIAAPPASSGLSAVLTGSELALRSSSGLQVLHAGATVSRPAELLGAERMRNLLGDFKDKFDYVVLDSPPVLAVTDAVVLSRLADITLLVARHGKTPRRSLERAYQLLASERSAKVEVVLNGVDRKSASYDEYYGYLGTTYYLNVDGDAHA